VAIKHTEIAGSKLAHRESTKPRNLGMNQATPERTNVKPASAINAPKINDVPHDDFSAGQELSPSDTAGLCSTIARVSTHTANI
jgi:hypothetical protein